METFKRYLVIQAMMFVFGIVGPIFLIMFFASQPDPTVKWAYWAGLFITAADILIALALTAGTSEKPKKQGAKTNRTQSGRSDTSGSSSSSSSSDPFLGGAVGFFSSDSSSSSDSGWSSSDSGSSSSDSGSSSSSD